MTTLTLRLALNALTLLLSITALSGCLLPNGVIVFPTELMPRVPLTPDFEIDDVSAFADLTATLYDTADGLLITLTADDDCPGLSENIVASVDNEAIAVAAGGRPFEDAECRPLTLTLPTDTFDVGQAHTLVFSDGEGDVTLTFAALDLEVSATIASIGNETLGPQPPGPTVALGSMTHAFGGDGLYRVRFAPPTPLTPGASVSEGDFPRVNFPGSLSRGVVDEAGELVAEWSARSWGSARDESEIVFTQPVDESVGYARMPTCDGFAACEVHEYVSFRLTARAMATFDETLPAGDNYGPCYNNDTCNDMWSCIDDVCRADVQ